MSNQRFSVVHEMADEFGKSGALNIPDSYQLQQFADFYDDMVDDFIDDDVQSMMDRLKDRPRDSMLLEMACGTGRLLGRIRKEFPNYKLHGSDLYKTMIDKCPTEAIELKASGMQDSWNELIGKLDIVLITAGSFHHLLTRDDQLQTLKLCRQYLKPNGIAIIQILKQEAFFGPWVQDGQPTSVTISSKTGHWTRTLMERYFADKILHDWFVLGHWSTDSPDPDEPDFIIKEGWSMRFIEPKEFDIMAKLSGFTITSDSTQDMIVFTLTPLP
jgi:SAM-dependent methyltransferase